MKDEPTPAELIQLACLLRPDVRTSGNREEIFAEVYGIWMEAKALIGRAGLTESEAIRRATCPESAEEMVGQTEYTITEAVAQLGYKETRGERSFWDLLKAAVKAGEFDFCEVKGGIVEFIAATERVDFRQLALLKDFKAKRARLGREAGGQAQAAKNASKQIEPKINRKSARSRLLE